MKEELEGMSTGELEALIERAQDVLSRRQSEDEWDRGPQTSATPGEGGMWLERELVSCGKCPRCLAGEKPHGPYWYLYSYTGAKMVSRYAGRRLGEEAARRVERQQLAGLKPEEAFPASYPEAISEEA